MASFKPLEMFMRIGIFLSEWVDADDEGESKVVRMRKTEMVSESMCDSVEQSLSLFERLKKSLEV